MRCGTQLSNAVSSPNIRTEDVRRALRLPSPSRIHDRTGVASTSGGRAQRDEFSTEYR